MSHLPYEGAANGERAIAEIERLLARFREVQSFGTARDYERGLVIVQFRHRGRQVCIEASTHGYAAAWLRAHPYTYRQRCAKHEHERKAAQVAQHAVCSILRDWIKGLVTAIETGVFSFEGAFLGQLVLPSGVTVLQHLDTQLKLTEGVAHGNG